MGLITETNAQYYAGQQNYIHDGGNATEKEYTWTGDTKLIPTIQSVSNTNFSISVNQVEQPGDQSFGYEFVNQQTFKIKAQVLDANNNVVDISNGDVILLQLGTQAIWNNNGEYQYVKLNDIISNFMTAYVGDGKYISRVARKDVIFHAKRGLQEFSYDTLKSLKSQEVQVPNNLNIIIPQDYVNYTRLSWVDENGVQRTIFPAGTLTMDPTDPLIQDGEGTYIQDNLEQNIQASTSITEDRWKEFDKYDLNGEFNWENNQASNIYNYAWWKTAYGQRYGLDPVVSQSNGWFTIDDRKGTFGFSSNLCKKIVIIEYVSDGLAYDLDSKVPKMIEEAMYMHIAYSILSSKIGTPEYVVQRFKKDRRAQLRNAKIRLQNLKLDTLIQVMRGKSKWLKH
tara:strand:- start:5297 stop:6484 length:1188 start_codon:yes stop_codon:yes gene_type:complete